MGCEHKRVKCVNCKFFCLDCGAKVEIPVYKAEHVAEKKPVRKTVKKGVSAK